MSSAPGYKQRSRVFVKWLTEKRKLTNSVGMDADGNFGQIITERDEPVCGGDLTVNETLDDL